MKLRDVPPDDPCGVALLEACEQAGIPTVQFNSGKTVTHGANWFQIASDENNVRSSSSKSYLHPIMDERQNLDVRTGCRAKRLLFDDEKRCIGAEYIEPGPLPLDPGRRPPRGDPELRVDRRPEAADALGHRPGRAPARVRHRRRSSTLPASARTSRTIPRAW